MDSIKLKKDYKKLTKLEKKKYLKILLNSYNLNQVLSALISDNDDISENFIIINEISKTKEFKLKNNISSLKLTSLMIDIYLKQNKSAKLNKYLNSLDDNLIKKIMDYEFKYKTDFSKLKLAKSLNNKINKNETLISENSKTKKNILKKEIKSKKIKVSIFFSIFIVFLIICYILVGWCYYILNFYNQHIYPNIYLDEKLISGIDNKELIEMLNKYDDKLNEILVLKNDNDSYEYSYKDIGLFSNKDSLEEEIIKKYQALNGYQKLYKIFFDDKISYGFEYLIDEEKYNNFIEDLKSKVNVEKTNEVFRLVNGNIKYSRGLNGFSLNEDGLKEEILSSIKIDLRELTLKGNIETVSNNLGSINKKVSTFTTYYNESQGRAKNIRNAVSKLNGKILYPNEMFSFYKTVGPYNGSRGFIFYGKDVGSGVCQVSTTLYNAALQLNLPIMSRENHGDMVYYVDYGLDATVYGSSVDMKFKNNSSYPIYIEASASGGVLTISLWSNDSIIKPGYSYKTRVEKISYLGFKTYLDTYLNGERIDTKYLNSSYYMKGK